MAVDGRARGFAWNLGTIGTVLVGVRASATLFSLSLAPKTKLIVKIDAEVKRN